ncbi:glycine betaine ABC transporter substrate-binding protein [Nocardioides acrostichi]|uniref:ABC-type glycine betaine transport system substrate-binding domain-containing protein n=1 Tax=Nocardioides acrostichi TaxID=2784339 RepID=A0A930V020_9ACTN|nr:glycine betaine ABC transporter substrate-binding protein [Nocardioides acrostichi]MBF4161549.1 hypothetical protein [Nocardioides acrostichi]
MRRHKLLALSTAALALGITSAGCGVSDSGDDGDSASGKATVCMETEFPDRPDGLVLFEKATGYKIPQSQIKILDTGLIYTETDKGNCDFGEVFTTDGRIQALNIDLVDDPGVFILYNLSFTWQDKVYEQHADTYDAIADGIFDGLDEDKMAELNGKVDVEGEPVKDVAEEYLDSVGMLDGGNELDGVKLTVGSKDFTENILVGEMLSQALEAQGADVNDKTNLGGTSVARDALLNGNIDVYPEYNGTGWTVHLGKEDPSSDPQELFDKTSTLDLKQNGIKWVGRSPFNDTYGFAVNGDLNDSDGPFDLEKMAEYLKDHQ